MKKILAAIIALVIVAILFLLVFFSNGKANANGFMILTQNSEAIDSYFYEGKMKQEYVDLINKNIENVPEQLFGIFGNNKINIFIELENRELKEYFAVTENGKLKELSIGANNEADIEVRTREKVLDKIVLSQNPMKEFLKAMNSNEIEYKGLSAKGKITQTGVSIVSNVAEGILNIFNFAKGIFR